MKDTNYDLNKVKPTLGSDYLQFILYSKEY